MGTGCLCNITSRPQTQHSRTDSLTPCKWPILARCFPVHTLGTSQLRSQGRENASGDRAVPAKVEGAALGRAPSWGNAENEIVSFWGREPGSRYVILPSCFSPGVSKADRRSPCLGLDVGTLEDENNCQWLTQFFVSSRPRARCFKKAYELTETSSSDLSFCLHTENLRSILELTPRQCQGTQDQAFHKTARRSGTPEPLSWL